MGVVHSMLRIRYYVLFFIISFISLFVSIDSAHAAPTNIILTSNQSVVRIEWSESSSNPVDDYTVEISEDNVNWLAYPHSPSSNTFIEIPRSLMINAYDMQLYIRITTEFSDASSSAATNAALTLPSYYGISKESYFNAGSFTTIVSDSQRKSLGLNWWMDSTMGLFKYNDQIVSLSANGPNTARIVKGETQFIGSVTNANTTIDGQTISSDHASGGPLYYDDSTGRLLMFYHGELHSPDATNFYSYIGLASSMDGGETFTDLGEIIRPDIDLSDPDRSQPVDVGSAPYIIKDGYFYVYFKDTDEDGNVINMTVARALVDNVLTAAESGTTSSWAKYHNGSFSEPGLGGSSQNIMTNHPFINWSDVIYLQDLNKYVMVYSNGSAGWNHLITTSTDGINWSTANYLYDSFSSKEMLYLTLSSPDFSNQRVVRGNEFYLFRTVSEQEGSNRWDNAWLERLTITFPASSESNNGSTEGEGDESSSATLAATGVSVLKASVVASLLIALALVGVFRHKLLLQIR